jgi:hypothetical protein
METQTLAQPTSTLLSPLPGSLTGAAGKQDAEPVRSTEEETTASDRDIYDEVACTD